MKKYKYNLILIFMLLFFIIFVSSCNDTDKHEVVDSTYCDDLGNVRPESGLYSESLIVNEDNYNLYKDKLIGDSGESKLINNDLIEKKREELNKNNKNYLIYYFYCSGVEKINISTYLKITLINESELLYDLDAISFDNYIINQYMSKKEKIDVEFDMTKDSFERLIVNTDYISGNPLFFTIVLPFSLKEEGKLYIDLSISEKNMNFEYQKNINAFVGDYLKEGMLATIDNYNISYI